MNILSDRKKNGTFKKAHKQYKPLKKKVCNLCKNKYMPKNFSSLYCSLCRVIKRKGWKKKYDNSEKKRIASRRYFSKKENRIKYQARWWVNEMIRRGKIKKPKICELCNKKNSKIYAHHYLGYEKEHRLDIQWLCANCHSDIHKKGGDV